MNKKYIPITVLITLILLLFASCSSSEKESDEPTEIPAEKSIETTGKSTEVETIAQEYTIEMYSNDTWDQNEYIIEAISHIFSLQERYYNHEFNYATLTQEMGKYLDLPTNFIKPDGVYGYTDVNDHNSKITNKDTAIMSEEEFNELLDRLSFYVSPYSISIIGGQNAEIDAVESIDRRYFISSIIEEDENSSIIYVKQLIYYEEVQPEFHTSVQDYWFLFKKDLGKAYSYRNWGTVNKSAEFDVNRIIMGSTEIEVEMFEITDSILSNMK